MREPLPSIIAGTTGAVVIYTCSRRLLLPLTRRTWPFPMTNNSGEQTAIELPRCRLAFNWAGLIYPGAEGASYALSLSSSHTHTLRIYMRAELRTLQCSNVVAC